MWGTALFDGNGTTRAVIGFTVVQSTLLAPTQLRIQQEFEDEYGVGRSPET
jgi:hypothetical protein